MADADRLRSIAASFEDWRAANRPDGMPVLREDLAHFLVWLQCKRPRVIGPVPALERMSAVETAVKRYTRAE